VTISSQSQSLVISGHWLTFLSAPSSCLHYL